jgi:hypothetical protein
MALQPGLEKRCRTDRTGARGLIEYLQVFDDCGRFLLTPAMAAHEELAVPVDLHGGAAVVAACHETIIDARQRSR